MLVKERNQSEAFTLDSEQQKLQGKNYLHNMISMV